jgi:hypothetical protein
VENDIQQNLLNEARPGLLAHLHDALKNDHINFRVDVNQGEAPPETWNERQLYNHMIEHSPAFADFVKKMRLKL